MILYSYEDIDDIEDSSCAWSDFKSNVETEIESANLSYPLTLEAQNSNWRGQTGYAEVKDFQDLMKKICSFDSSFIEFHKDNDEYYFKLATHDVPCGFCVYIKQGQSDE